MNRWTRPLEIAFMGYNTPQTQAAFQQFARDNQEEIRTDLSKMGLLTLKDGTRITEIFPRTAGRGIREYKYDQLILADDSRKKIYSARWREISLFLQTAMDCSRVPEDYKILFYDLDAPDPRDETGKGAGEHGSPL